MRKLLFASLLSVFVIAIALLPSKNDHAKSFHTQQEIALLKFYAKDNGPTRAPIDSDQYFLTSFRCQGCHGYDPLHFGSTIGDSTDVNLYDDWSTSMMALSAVDPLWRAKVSHEILTNPAHADALQTKCTSCHSPMGHFTAIYHGEQNYSMDQIDGDSLGVNGVACSGCHSIGTENLGSRFSGDIPYDTNNVEYGPFTDPVTGPMQLYVGITPAYSLHMSEGRFCSPCHTLITETADLNGNSTGGTFVEQATFHEWKNSVYPSQEITCQTCHMPQLEEAVVIANGDISLLPRSPFNQHQFMGSNAFMIKLMKENKEKLNIGAPDVNFDSTIALTYKMLQQQTINMELQLDTVKNDTAYFDVSLLNKAGHKFPSGYPSRRAVVQFIATNESGDTIFKSGMLDNSFEVIGINNPFEPHYNIIKSENDVQVYEMVMADVNGNKTTLLERGADFLKDNRIPPQGFTTTHASYDTMKIISNALTDPDFNKTGMVEGSGKDIVHYHVPMNGYVGKLNIEAAIIFQAVPPSWLTEMFTLNSPAIDSFRNMFNAADQEPILVAKDTLQNVDIISTTNYISLNNGISVYPNPANQNFTNLYTHGLKIESVSVLNSNGIILNKIEIEKQHAVYSIPLPAEKGIYYLLIRQGTNKTLKKVIRL